MCSSHARVQGVEGGAQGVLDLLSGSGTLRGILESAGFVLQEVLEDAGLTLEVSGHVFTGHGRGTNSAMTTLHFLFLQRCRAAAAPIPNKSTCGMLFHLQGDGKMAAAEQGDAQTRGKQAPATRMYAIDGGACQ